MPPPVCVTHCFPPGITQSLRTAHLGTTWPCPLTPCTAVQQHRTWAQEPAGGEISQILLFRHSIAGFLASPPPSVPLLWALCPLAAALPCRQHPLVSSLITASAVAKRCSYCAEKLFNSPPWLVLRKKQL